MADWYCKDMVVFGCCRYIPPVSDSCLEDLPLELGNVAPEQHIYNAALERCGAASPPSAALMLNSWGPVQDPLRGWPDAEGCIRHVN